jgi:hypothetical protein
MTLGNCNRLLQIIGAPFPGAELQPIGAADPTPYMTPIAGLIRGPISGGSVVQRTIATVF